MFERCRIDLITMSILESPPLLLNSPTLLSCWYQTSSNRLLLHVGFLIEMWKHEEWLMANHELYLLQSLCLEVDLKMPVKPLHIRQKEAYNCLEDVKHKQNDNYNPTAYFSIHTIFGRTCFILFYEFYKPKSSWSPWILVIHYLHCKTENQNLKNYW